MALPPNVEVLKVKPSIAYLLLLWAVPAWAQQSSPTQTPLTPTIAPDIDDPPMLERPRVNTPNYNDSALYDDRDPAYEDDADTDADDRGGALRNMLISVGN